MIVINVITITTLFGLAIILSFSSVAVLKGIDILKKVHE
jgi:hypothetical protein